MSQTAFLNGFIILSLKINKSTKRRSNDVQKVQNSSYVFDREAHKVALVPLLCRLMQQLRLEKRVTFITSDYLKF